MELGAIDFVAKPRIDIAGTLEDYESELIAKVRVAAQARVLPRSEKRARVTDERNSTSAVVPALSGTRDVADDGPHHRHRCFYRRH